MVDFTPRIAEVPTELVPLIDDQFMETQERWQNASFEQVVPYRPALNPVDLGNEVVCIAELPSRDWDGSVVALAHPFLQGLNDTMILRASFMQQAVMPNTRVLMIPNQTFTFSAEDKVRLAEGSLRPLGEKIMRVLEKKRTAQVSITGYSQGSNAAVETAAVGSDVVEVVALNADEVASAPDRASGQLRKDFRKSSGYNQQRKSMGESGFGSLMEQYAGDTLLLDYAKFGIASLGRASRLIQAGMTGSIRQSFREALIRYPDMRVKFGVVEGSNMSQLEDLTLPRRAKIARYTGAAANGHTTGDNYAAHALMVKHGLQLC